MRVLLSKMKETLGYENGKSCGEKVFLQKKGETRGRRRTKVSGDEEKNPEKNALQRKKKNKMSKTGNIQFRKEETSQSDNKKENIRSRREKRQ